MKSSWKIKIDNRLRGAYGETDYEKKIIRINKKRHKSTRHMRITPNKDGSEKLIATLHHEVNHVLHPKKREKTVRKEEKTFLKKGTQKAKKKLYSLISKTKKTSAKIFNPAKFEKTRKKVFGLT